MPFVLEDLSPGAIIKAMEANLFQYFWPYGGLPQGEIHFEEGCTWFVSGVAEKWFNGVVDTRFEPDNLNRQVEQILNHFRQRSLPMSWNIGPGTRPAALGKALTAHGLSHENDEPGMALDLLNMNEPEQSPANFTVEPVLDRATLQEWAAVWLEDVPDPVAEHCREVLFALGISPGRPWRYYLGRVKGKPVATIQLFYAAGVVSAQHVATLRKAQGAGFGTALTVQALREAREQGYRVAVLTATPQGIPMYRKIGFRTYASISSYSWQPGQE
ncbi:MAG: N-acetyltransferase [Chloroflexi bacterium]|jgi:GNAT superfamily N-acetyltransferase|nr:N-acetyltransferase [Chloroflexota bacterium]